MLLVKQICFKYVVQIHFLAINLHRPFATTGHEGTVIRIYFVASSCAVIDYLSGQNSTILPTGNYSLSCTFAGLLTWL